MIPALTGPGMMIPAVTGPARMSPAGTGPGPMKARPGVTKARSPRAGTQT